MGNEMHLKYPSKTKHVSTVFSSHTTRTLNAGSSIRPKSVGRGEKHYFEKRSSDRWPATGLGTLMPQRPWRHATTHNDDSARRKRHPAKAKFRPAHVHCMRMLSLLSHIALCPGAPHVAQTCAVPIWPRNFAATPRQWPRPRPPRTAFARRTLRQTECSSPCLAECEL